MLRSAVKITFSSFKFSGPHASAIILPQINSPLCPVQALHVYLRVRPMSPGALFVTSLGSPLTSDNVRSVLHQLADHLGLAKTTLSSHSFRIRAATTAVAVGISDACIMRMGRWSSTAFWKYIRCQVNAFWLGYPPLFLSIYFSGWQPQGVRQRRHSIWHPLLIRSCLRRCTYMLPRGQLRSSLPRWVRCP